MGNTLIRRSIILVAVFTLVFGCLCGCGKNDAASAKQTEYIGIISAMDNEIELLLEEAEIDHVDTYGGVDYNVGTLCNHPVIITRSGIGKVRSASAASALLNNYTVSKVIFTGIAGGVGDSTQVLDEVIATKLVQHDYGMMNNDGFEWSDESGGEDGYYICDEELVSKAYDAAVEVLGESHVFEGVIATGDQFIASEEYVKKLQDDFDALACEMEGASVACVCTYYDVPFVVIRAMSDKADGKAYEAYDNMGDIAAEQSSKIVLNILENN